MFDSLVDREIARSIRWEDDDGNYLAFESLPSRLRADLESTVENLLAGRPPDVPSEPPLVSAGPNTVFDGATAWRVFCAHVGQSLAFEAGGAAPWSLRDLTEEDRHRILGSRSLFVREALGFRVILEGAPVGCGESHGGVTPGDPRVAFEFLRDQDLIGKTRLETIHRLLDWCRVLHHFEGEVTAENLHRQWQYRGLPPVSKVLAGTTMSDDPDGEIKHRTLGCFGTTGLLRAVLRTVNIPVVQVERIDHGFRHALPGFPTEGLFLSHGDDPYNRLMKADPEIPIDRLLLNEATFEEWFGEPVTDRIGAQPRVLAVEFLSERLLAQHTADLLADRPPEHPENRVARELAKVFTVDELRQRDLWRRLNEKLERRLAASVRFNARPL